MSTAHKRGKQQTDVILDAFRRLLDYCRGEDFKGYDPHDGLNSRIFARLGFQRSPVARLVLSTLCRRSPLNLRPLLGVERGHNPKGIALCLSALVRYARISPGPDVARLLEELKRLLRSLKSTGYSGACWGYNFDWQSRIFFYRNTPRQ